jgi:hypothetical protein
VRACSSQSAVPFAGCSPTEPRSAMRRRSPAGLALALELGLRVRTARLTISTARNATRVLGPRSKLDPRFTIGGRRGGASRWRDCSVGALARCTSSGRNRRGRGPTSAPAGSASCSARRRSGLLPPAARELCAVFGDCCRSLCHSCLQFVSFSITLANGGIF